MCEKLLSLASSQWSANLKSNKITLSAIILKMIHSTYVGKVLGKGALSCSSGGHSGNICQNFEYL